MSPHAVSALSSSAPSEASPYETSLSSMDDDIPSLVGDSRGSSNLHRFGDDEVQDLVAVGFGPASLAIAVALHDSLEDPSLQRSRLPKVRFLEKQPKFAWHAGMLLPGAKMQITFLKDMATLRNPQSEFTFLKYLHAKDRLVSFTNLNTFLPQRTEYEDYMRWCAEHFSNVVDYSQDVQKIERGRINPRTGEIEYFNVTSVNNETGERFTLKARHVVISAGGRPYIPKSLPEHHPRIIHSSQYMTHIHKIFPEGSHPKTVAVVGAGQSAAECWHDIPSRFPGAQSLLLIRGAALRPSDDSPFVNEVFNPQRVEDTFSQEPRLRQDALAADKATNYGVVRLEFIERIYDEMYGYKLQYSREQDWPHRILKYRSVTGMRDVNVDGKPAVELQIQNNSGMYCATESSGQETVTADLVVVATGYLRNSHEEMLCSLQDLMPGGSAHGKKWTVGRDYAVEFSPGAVSPEAGIWLQGCNEKTHGLSDTLLSILAVRGGEMVESIFGSPEESQQKGAIRGLELR